jgi:hypothetical protein
MSKNASPMAWTEPDRLCRALISDFDGCAATGYTSSRMHHVCGNFDRYYRVEEQQLFTQARGFGG